MCNPHAEQGGGDAVDAVDAVPAIEAEVTSPLDPLRSGHLTSCRAPRAAQTLPTRLP
jgi:hypothetical protein